MEEEKQSIDDVTFGRMWCNARVTILQAQEASGYCLMIQQKLKGEQQ
jgi:hypothetical protein